MCGEVQPEWTAGVEPSTGAAAFYLVAPVVDGIEGSLGTDGSGQERPNANPCPP